MSSTEAAPLIAIVGGGPCGFMFASLLESAGYEYVVFERDESTGMTPSGTFDLHPKTGQEALRRAGLTDKFEAVARRDATTMVMHDLGADEIMKIGEGRDAPEIDRLQLRQLLLDSIPAHKVKWGKVLTEIKNEDAERTHGGAAAKRWELHFADGTSESGFRLVVGADGSLSKIRPLITSCTPQYVGKMFIEGRISHDNPQYKSAFDLAGPGNSMGIGTNNCILGVQQVADAIYRVYMGINVPEDFTRDGGPADLEDLDKARSKMLSDEFYGSWPANFRSFVEDSEGPWRAWPWRRMDPDIYNFAPEGETDTNSQRWKRVPGITLLGDAAHASTPNGEGANEAMYDALALFEQIQAELGKESIADGGAYDEEADAERIERAVDAYEKEMRSRAPDFISRCAMMEDMMFSSGIIQKFKAMKAKQKQEAEEKEKNEGAEAEA